MGNPQVIPLVERSPILMDFLSRQVREVARLRREIPALLHLQTTPLLALCYPWIVQPAPPAHAQELAEIRVRLQAAGFNGEGAVAELEQILAQDRHLRECCPTVGHLVHWCDLSFIERALLLVQLNAPEEHMARLHEEFSATTYHQGRFKSVALSHLFNVAAEEPSLRIADVQLERLDSPTISGILGEASIQSFIHPPGCGDYFMVSEREGPCDDLATWLFEEKRKAEMFAQVLQYFKDGVVHVDYAVPHFLPQWVNEIRKFGIFFVGSPRRTPHEGGELPYRVARPEIVEIARWVQAYSLPRVRERLDDTRNTMRQAGLRAGEYYEHSHTQEKAVGRMVTLAIALEALFSPDEKGEFTFRISQGVSQMVGSTPDERSELFREMKRFYGLRSQLVHGQYDVEDYYNERFVTHADCDRWASVIRLAILRFLALYLRGCSNKQTVQTRLSSAALDSLEAERLREESDPSRLLNELIPPAAGA